MMLLWAWCPKVGWEDSKDEGEVVWHIRASVLASPSLGLVTCE